MSDQQSTMETSATDTLAETDILSVSTQDYQGMPVVVADGDVDLSTAPYLKTALDSACGSRTEPGNVGLDLRLVPFIDSAGLALLVEIRKRHFDKCQLALVIEKGSQPERVLRLGRFDTFLKVGYSLEEVQGSDDTTATAAN
jgi:anti-anti-sigma factor